MLKSLKICNLQAERLCGQPNNQAAGKVEMHVLKEEPCEGTSKKPCDGDFRSDFGNDYNCMMSSCP